MMKFVLITCTAFLLLACEQTSGSTTEAETTTEETTPAGDIASMIRNPVTADSEQVDSTTVAKLEFGDNTHNFGWVDEGAVVKHDFEFTNTGTVPLVISDVRSTCGCTVAEWPREPIAPGGTGKIPVQFDTKNKKGVQSKPITITANTLPAKTILYLNGRINE